MKIRKELWFGFSLMAIILVTVVIFTPWGGFVDGHLSRDDLDEDSRDNGSGGGKANNARFGSQAVVVAIDAKRDGSRFAVCSHAGRTPTSWDAAAWARVAFGCTARNAST